MTTTEQPPTSAAEMETIQNWFRSVERLPAETKRTGEEIVRLNGEIHRLTEENQGWRDENQELRDEIQRSRDKILRSGGDKDQHLEQHRDNVRGVLDPSSRMDY